MSPIEQAREEWLQGAGEILRLKAALDGLPSVLKTAYSAGAAAQRRIDRPLRDALHAALDCIQGTGEDSKSDRVIKQIEAALEAQP